MDNGPAEHQSWQHQPVQPPAQPNHWEQPTFVPQPPAPAPTPPPAPAADDMPAPMPVLNVLSPRGIEYAFMTISLFISSIGLTSVLIALVNGKAGFEVLSFPVATMLVSVPIFAWLFLRLKKAELTDPSLKRDVSKRRNTQFTQIVTFLITMFTLIGLITVIFAKIGGQYDSSMVKTILDCLVLLVVYGGILVYYWVDEHRRK